MVRDLYTDGKKTYPDGKERYSLILMVGDPYSAGKTPWPNHDNNRMLIRPRFMVSFVTSLVHRCTVGQAQYLDVNVHP